MRRPLALTLLVAFPVASTAPAGPIDPRKIPGDLKCIAVGYHACHDATGTGPNRAEDLGPYIENDPRLLGLLKNNNIVLFYGYKITECPEGSSNTVMGFEKDAPCKGGWVVMFDGSIKKMSADDFRKATFPPRK